MVAAYVDALVETAPEGIAFDGLRVTGEGPFTFQTPAGEHTGVSESRLRELASGSVYATNWYFWHALAPQKPDRWAFLRWLERAGRDSEPVPQRYERLADGRTSEWGQLSITVRLGENGRRTYDVSNIDDEETPSPDLEMYRNPLDAREIATFGDDGRYRPLKTAPTLRRGWAFESLGPAELVQTVDFLYPATVANWHRERDGSLDVTHWHETVTRQTGIYGVVETWDRGEGHEHVEWVAETHCVDEECLKRREWDVDGETQLDVDRGGGHFPCREPCSFVISAARTYTRLDAEGTETYEFELTPSEREQLEMLVDAVADGRTDEIREADFGDAANRFRARFLRARRFADGDDTGPDTDD